MKDRLKEIIDAERWDERLGTLNAINATLHNSALDRVESKVRELLPPVMKPELNKASAPKMMKRYSEDCKPEAAGWYWVAYRGYEPEPEYFDGFTWFESESGNETILDPLLWLEMDPPTIPEGGA
jgi:hypothetical protein